MTSVSFQKRYRTWHQQLIVCVLPCWFGISGCGGGSGALRSPVAGTWGGTIVNIQNGGGDRDLQLTINGGSTVSGNATITAGGVVSTGPINGRYDAQTYPVDPLLINIPNPQGATVCEGGLATDPRFLILRCRQYSPDSKTVVFEGIATLAAPAPVTPTDNGGG